MMIYDDNSTPDDYTDDVMVSVIDAKNAVDNSSNGKWEDGNYDMYDQMNLIRMEMKLITKGF